MTNRVQELETQLDVLVEELYREHRQFTPMYPWVLVRVLEREQMYKDLVVLPDKDQNKTIHEGIVVATWKSFVQEVDRKWLDSGEWLSKSVYKESAFELGEHVAFPHWVGIPVPGYQDSKYRLIKEEDWHETKEGGILFAVDYSPVEERGREKARGIVDEWLRGVLDCSDTGEPRLSKDEAVSALLSKLDHQFLMVDRDGQSVTLSGR